MNGFMNSPGLWIVCGIPVVTAIVQSFIYIRRAIKFAKELGYSKEVISKCVRSSAITAIGPACSIGVGVVALMGVIGGPLAWLKLSDVGALGYEIIVSDMATSALGVTTDSMTPQIFAAMAFAMGLAGCFWQLNAIFFAPSYETVLTKVSRGDTKVLTLISTAAMAGITSRTAIPYAMNAVGTFRPFAATVIAAGLFLVIQLLIKKLNWKWLIEWSLPIAMFGAMFLTLLTPNTL